MQTTNENEKAKREFYVSVTQRGQLTLPVEAQRALKTRVLKKVMLTLEGEEITIRPTRYTLEQICGSVKPLKSRLSWKEIEREAKEEHAQRIVDKMNRQ